MKRASAASPLPSPLEATLYFTTWCLSPYYNHGAYNISIIAVAMAKYCYFHGQVHGYYRGLRSQHPSIQPAESHRPTGRTDEAHQREHRRIAARRAVNAAPTVRNTALPPAIKNKIKKQYQDDQFGFTYRFRGRCRRNTRRRWRVKTGI